VVNVINVVGILMSVHVYSVANSTLCWCDQVLEFLHLQELEIFVENLESGPRWIAHANTAS